MTTLKIIYLLLTLAASCLVSSMFAQQRPAFYLDARVGGPQSEYLLPGPTLQTGILISRQIGVGVMGEFEPTGEDLRGGFGWHIRLSSFTAKNQGWHITGAAGQGRERAKNDPGRKSGYVFREITLSRHFASRWVLGTGFRWTTDYRDWVARVYPKQRIFRTIQLGYLFSKPSPSSSHFLQTLNRKTYLYSLYGINIPVYDWWRSNALLNMGIGWKVNPTWGLGISSNFSFGINTYNADYLEGLGLHAIRKKSNWLNFFEMGWATKRILTGVHPYDTPTLMYLQDPSTTPIYTRFGLGFLFQKILLIHTSFTLAPRIKGTSTFRTPPTSSFAVPEQDDFYFGYVQFHIGLGFYIE